MINFAERGQFWLQSKVRSTEMITKITILLYVKQNLRVEVNRKLNTGSFKYCNLWVGRQKTL